MKSDEIRKELDTIERKIQPLQRKQWRLHDQFEKAIAQEVLASLTLEEDMSWRLRISQLKVYLQYEPEPDLQMKGKQWPDLIDEIIPYPHSHFELEKGVMLNQDDGDITITFDTIYQLHKFIRDHNLKILEWNDLRTFIKKMRAYRSLFRQLEWKAGN